MKSDNELIAEFMGAERREGQRAFNPDEKLVQWIIKGNPYNQHRDDILHWYQPVELKYHESWDWLMPVVEKIETLNFSVMVIGKYTRIQCPHPYKEFATDICDTKIQSVYKVVVEFIKFYNDQDKALQ